jgi:hypothetical protein
MARALGHPEVEPTIGGDGVPRADALAVPGELSASVDLAGLVMLDLAAGRLEHCQCCDLS